MTTFSYTAISLGPGGRATNGELEAPSESDLKAQLRARGLLMLRATPHGPARRLKTRPNVRSSERDVRWLFETLSALLDGAAPLEQAVESMITLAPNGRLRETALHMHTRLREGATLDDALGSASVVLAPRYGALLRVGHHSGRLAHCVRLVHESLETRACLRHALIGRMLYPAILLLAALAALWGIAAIVLPRFALTLESLGGQLPWATGATLAAAEILVWAIPAALLVVAILGFTRRRWMTPSMRAAISRRVLRLPILGPAIWNAQALALCESLGVMLEGGADLAHSIDHAQHVLDSREIAARFERASKDVHNGVEFGQALASHDVLPPLTLVTLRAGCESGDLSGALRRATSACFERQERVAQRLMTLLEPAMIVFLATIVLWIVYALLTGMLAMNDVQGI